MLGRRRMSQAQLSREMGQSQMWVSDRLRGIQPIGLDDLERFARALDTEPYDLLPGRIGALPGRDELKKNLAAPKLPVRNDHVRVTHGGPIAPPRRDSTRPGSDVPANRRRPVSVRPSNRPMAA